MNKTNRNRISVFTATTTSKQVFSTNKGRKAFLIVNNGANIVEFCEEKRPYGQGFPVSPGRTIDDDHFNPQGELFVIATTGDTDLRVWEILSEET